MEMWKFTVGIDTYAAMDMPKGAKVLSVQMQGERLCLWALVNPSAERESRAFQVFGTGHAIPSHARYCGSTQDGPFVWHLFELLTPEQETREALGAFLGMAQ